jgi:II/X family phage/plasmid replication protein
MIDTVTLQSPYLSEHDAEQIALACERRSALVVATGEKLYEFTSGSLAGSWDSRVSVRVEREEWVAEAPSVAARMSSTGGSDVEVVRVEGQQVARSTGVRRLRPVVTKQECPPYIVIEGSVHKALLGHNVYGGPCAPALSLAWFVDDVAKRLGVALPYSEDWTAKRVDWAEAYELPNFEACQEFVGGLNMAKFPRRSVDRYGETGLYSPGRTTTIKIYHKGPEFHKHDKPRLRRCLVDDMEIYELQARANCILRFETEIKARKLSDDFDGKPSVALLTQEYCERVHDREAGRLLKEANNDMETVRTNQAVSRRLHEMYDDRLANTLFGTWFQLAALGEVVVKKSMTKPTYYRQKKQLSEAAISWLASDVYVVPTGSAIPFGFSPVRGDRHRMTDEHPIVSEKLGLFSRPGFHL